MQYEVIYNPIHIKLLNEKTDCIGNYCFLHY